LGDLVCSDLVCSDLVCSDVADGSWECAERVSHALAVVSDAADA